MPKCQGTLGRYEQNKQNKHPISFRTSMFAYFKRDIHSRDLLCKSLHTRSACYAITLFIIRQPHIFKVSLTNTFNWTILICNFLDEKNIQKAPSWEIPKYPKRLF